MKKYFSVFIIVALLVFQSCQPKKNIVYLSNNNFEQEVSQARYEGLHIQEGDRLQILVSAFEEIAVRPFNLSTMAGTGTAGMGSGSGGSSGATEYTVTTDGTIVFPVLGSVYCKGMTKQQLKQDLESRLKRFLTDPMVTVTLSNFNFSVLGEVKGPGQKTSPTEKLNLFQAIALAGDLTYDANKTNVKLIRYSEEEARDKVISLDLSEVSIVNSPYYYLQQNDILYVEPDRNKQMSVNTNSNVDNWIKYGGIGLGLITLIFTLTRK
ncbi:polysaccharide biosynthesis/export family protein [Chryseobacterium gotjawalense]|uniref:Polysaccharide biosynthesis/export family protein n=1 Tax=Chryseobacterium gotjawalense TaxID=3042315 RepID=A0ABY8RBS8_9FLAO|nr:polysaccharide biosynthesis/export family protein [Chryseobacterium sp. wdc7]WHF51416.1 polysaccharide biosynthesis/export family protein [Chryseobacterium sp. wdc7]